MKYGEQFERESVPEWSLHNIDYNALKHHIKVHTTRDQASAIAIPGHQDTALAKFEDELFLELCRQHDRVDLFVTSKADELSRRLQHLSHHVQRLLLRCATSSSNHVSFKRQQRIARYERQLAGCGHDIQSLSRFVNAQAVAFRKILKKYRKWTGSAALGSRFKDTVLSHPKSFTRRDYSHLRLQYDNLSAALQAVTPAGTGGTLSPSSPPGTPPGSHNDASSGVNGVPGPASQPRDFGVDNQQGYQEGYWNEYEYGSEAGDMDKQADGGYAIYVDPQEDAGFPGMATLVAMFRVPVEKARTWLTRGLDEETPGTDQEHGPLLTGSTYDYGSAQASYPGSADGDSLFPTDTEAEDSSYFRPIGRRRPSYPTSDDFPAGYSVHLASGLPSIEEQRSAARYRARVLLRATVGGFAVSFVLLGLTGVLISAGRRRLRAEVDAGAVVGAVASLACACAALSVNVARPDPPGWAGWLAVWAAFAVVCALNGVLLVVVAGRSGL